MLSTEYGEDCKLKQVAHANAIDINFNKNKGLGGRIQALIMDKLEEEPSSPL